MLKQLDMFEFRKNEIPNHELLTTNINTALKSLEVGIDNIRYMIYEHVMARTRYCNKQTWNKMTNSTMTLSYNAIDDVIYNLEINELNCKRLMEFINIYYSYAAFERLLYDFSVFLGENDRKSIIERGKNIFIKDLTDQW